MNMAKTDCMAVALFGREGGSSCGGWFVNAVEALGEVWGGPATAREAGGPRLPRGEGPVATAVPPPENYILATAQVLLLHCPPPAPPCR